MLEEASYKKFSSWCGTTSTEYEEKVKVGKDEIEELGTSIDSMKSQKAITESNVAKRQTAMEASMTELTGARAECLREQAAYQATQADIHKAVDQIEGAIKALSDA